MVMVALVFSAVGSITNYADAVDSSKISVCHKAGPHWKYMNTPDQSAYSAHIGHGDFDYTGPEDGDKDAWCEANVPAETPADLCENVDGNQDEGDLPCADSLCENGWDADTQSCNVPPQELDATIHVQKVVCENESDLPNWGNHGVNHITSTTATDFVAAHPNCDLADWDFQWAPSSTSNPGDNVNAGGSPWTIFSGSVSIPAPTNPAYVWIREVTDDAYIPFSSATSNLDS
ncbi:hypothetical protein K2P96_01300, partial [Patescibacteria group bacterium]|nr:hypothetical protein [Patescibacteria group bacterium]